MKTPVNVRVMAARAVITIAIASWCSSAVSNNLPLLAEPAR